MNKARSIIITVLLFSFFTFAFDAGAATYYVGQGAGDSDSNSCTTAQTDIDGSRKRTIANADANCGGPGNTIIVRPGTYHERLNITKSGTSGAPYTIQGTKSGATFSTIINGTDLLTSWSQDLTMDPSGRVWRTTMPTWNGDLTTGLEPCALTADGKDIWHVGHSFGSINNLFTTDAAATDTTSIGTVAFWDGIEALFANRSGFTYIRFRNGDNPNNKTIRVAPWSNQCVESGAYPEFANVLFRNVHDVVVRDFELAGGPGVAIRENTSNITVTNNRIHGGSYKIIVYGLNPKPTAYTISNNEIFSNSIGFAIYAPQAWGYYAAPQPYRRQISEHQYMIDKYTVGTNQDQMQVGIGIMDSPGTGTISGNICYYMNSCVQSYGLTNLTIIGNTAHDLYGSAFYWQTATVGTIKVANNLIYDVTTPIRSNYMESQPAGTVGYIYNNRVQAPSNNGTGFGTGVSFQIYFSSASGANSQATYYVYHNTFIGGTNGFTAGAVSGFGWPNVLFINNLHQLAYPSTGSVLDMSADMCDNAGRIAAWDYNWTFGSMPSCVWAGIHNAVGGAKIITDTVMPAANWAASGTAIAAGIDIAHNFTVNGINYSPLPGFNVGYFSGAAPNIGAVIGGPNTITITSPATSTITVSTATITIGGTSTP